MLVVRVDCRDAIGRNSISPFERERLVGGLQFDKAADTVVAQMHPRLEILRTRIERQFCESQPKNGRRRMRTCNETAPL